MEPSGSQVTPSWQGGGLAENSKSGQDFLRSKFKTMQFW